MKIIFMGTPDFSVPTLTEIVSSGHEVVAVYTRAPKPAGRGQAERKSPVHLAAEGFGIEVRTPRSLKGADEQAAFAALEADVAVVVAYGLILPAPILAAPFSERGVLTSMPKPSAARCTGDLRSACPRPAGFGARV